MSKNIPPNSDWESALIDDEPFESVLYDNIDKESMAYQEKERYKQDTGQRLFLARWVVWATSIWLGIVLCIVVCQGLQLFKLHTTTINTLLVTTTANVLGLAYIVLQGLFGDKSRRYRKKR